MTGLSLCETLDNYELFQELLFCFDMFRIGNYTVVYGTNRFTGRFVVVSFTLRTEVRVDLIDAITHVDRVIWTLRLTHITVGAFSRDKQSHRYLPVGLRVSCPETRLRINNA